MKNCDDDDAATTVTLCGYELIGNLDFANGADYGLGVVNTEWRPDMTDPGNATNAGFSGFGADSGSLGGFTAIFEGNGHSIANFYSRSTASTGKNVGLFRLLSSPAHIRNVGLTGVHVYGGEGIDNIGGLVGYNSSIITTSHASGNVHGGGDNDNVGGLVGYSFNRGTITASHASASVHGGAGDDSVGGLVGQNAALIRASYATGHPDGGVGSDTVGGLTGLGTTGTVSASYASGNPHGGDDNDFVGGLLGQKWTSLMLTASYATGNPDGGDGDMDRVGELTGRLYGTFTESYAFGTVSNNDVTTSAAGDPSSGTAHPSGVRSAANLTGDSTAATTYAGASWDSESDGTKGAWNFGTNMQNPALVYADYDGAGTAFPLCTNNNGGFPEHVPGTTITLECGTTLIGGQGR